MQTDTDVAAKKHGLSTVNLKKSLIPIDEYALREGITENIIEQCGEIGLLQLRKFRGKKFVVDVPLRKARQDESEDDMLELLEPGRKIRTLQIAALLLTAFLITSLIFNLMLHLNKEITIEMPSQAYVAAENTLNESVQLRQDTIKFQNFLSVSRAELQRLQNQLAVSSIEVEGIGNELAKSRQSIETIQIQLTPSRENLRTIQNELIKTHQSIEAMQQQNSQAIEQLNRQIQKSKSQLNQNP